MINFIQKKSSFQQSRFMSNKDNLNKFISNLQVNSSQIFCLTGAGISAESGLATFRASKQKTQDKKGGKREAQKYGLWDNYDISEVASIEGFRKNPSLVHEFYNLRRREINSEKIKPNKAHIALAKLEQYLGNKVWIITQNIDNLHQKAGSKNVIHLHGEINKVICQSCKSKFEFYTDLSIDTVCENCSQKQTLREDIVWFGEMPYHLNKIYDLLTRTNCFISIGTSGIVYPASAFVDALNKTAVSLQINLEETDNNSKFDYLLFGEAGSITENLVDNILKIKK